MSNFAAALRDHLEKQPDLGLMEARAHRIVSNPDAPRNARIIARWEEKSAASLGFDPSGIIDWFKANWKTILQVVLTVLGLVLMFAEPVPTDTVLMSAVDAEAEWFPGKNIIEQFLPEILDAYVMPPLNLAVQDLQGRMAGLPASLGWNAVQAKAWILAKFKESQA